MSADSITITNDGPHKIRIRTGEHFTVTPAANPVTIDLDVGQTVQLSADGPSTSIPNGPTGGLIVYVL